MKRGRVTAISPLSALPCALIYITLTELSSVFTFRLALNDGNGNTISVKSRQSQFLIGGTEN